MAKTPKICKFLQGIGVECFFSQGLNSQNDPKTDVKEDG